MVKCTHTALDVYSSSVCMCLSGMPMAMRWQCGLAYAERHMYTIIKMPFDAEQMRGVCVSSQMTLVPCILPSVCSVSVDVKRLPRNSHSHIYLPLAAQHGTETIIQSQPSFSPTFLRPPPNMSTHHRIATHGIAAIFCQFSSPLSAHRHRCRRLRRRHHPPSPNAIIQYNSITWSTYTGLATQRHDAAPVHLPPSLWSLVSKRAKLCKTNHHRVVRHLCCRLRTVDASMYSIIQTQRPAMRLSKRIFHSSRKKMVVHE